MPRNLLQICIDVTVTAGWQILNQGCPIWWPAFAKPSLVCYDLRVQQLIAWLQRVLLMDEISTGLDSATTYSVAKFLSNTTHVMGLTTMIGLLQPPPEVYAIFDDVLLLTDGYSICRHLPCCPLPFSDRLYIHLCPSLPCPALPCYTFGCPALPFLAVLLAAIPCPALPCRALLGLALLYLLDFATPEL